MFENVKFIIIDLNLRIFNAEIDWERIKGPSNRKSECAMNYWWIIGDNLFNFAFNQLLRALYKKKNM